MPAEPKRLTQEEMAAALTSGRSRGPRKDPTEPRETGTWFKLNHTMREEGCENPQCEDPRDADDVGRKAVALIKEKYMCRYCFLSGWLSNADTAVN